MTEVKKSEWRREDCYFDRIQGELVLRHILEHGIKGDILDVACGDGLLTQKFSQCKGVSSITGLDGSADAVIAAKARQYECPVDLSSGFFEDFKTDKVFDSIVAINVLEHVKDHILFLKKMKPLLKKDGKVFIYVPNAESLHVLLAVEMGVISDKYYLNQWQRDFCGHTIHYDMDILAGHLQQAGLNIKDLGSIIFKPLSNGQMDYLLNAPHWDERENGGKEVRGWGVSRERLFDGVYTVGNLPQFKRFGSTLSAHCTL
jgi:2-polyprenyl-3-methyl-5-hydroxy-6-metoxy-1,4-benzoquinol methylase